MSISTQVEDLLQQDKVIEAIKLYRRETGSGLRDAKHYIEGLRSQRRPSSEDLKTMQTEAPVVEVPDYVEEVQRLVMEKIECPSGINREVQSVLTLIKDYPDSLIEQYLGDLGSRLKSFANKINVNHPSVADVQSGTLVKGGKVFRRVTETLQWAEFAKDKEFQEMPGVIQRWFGRNHKRITKILQKPPARLLTDPTKARSTTKYKDVELRSQYEVGKASTWDLLPESFTPYCRMGPGFTETIDYYERMSNYAKDMGMVVHAAQSQQDTQRFNDILADQYNGFIRVKMYDAAMIAAKAMGATWPNRQSKIFVNATHFKHDFWQADRTGKMEENPYISDVFEKHVTVDAHYRQANGEEKIFSLQPRAYPLHRFILPRPKRVSQILEAIEHHADVGGNALFDNIWVIVPSVVVNSGHTDYYEFHDGEKSTKFYEYWDYAKALDKFLVQTGQIFPVILGENTSKKRSYFVSYWA